ncbi:hypothetical protein ACTFIR_000805 [Dictyostelium discoideum]
MKDNNNYNDKSFFKLWRNYVIKKEILLHVKLYNIHYHKRVFENVRQLNQYKFKDYLRSVEISNSKEFILLKNELPNSIKEIHFPYGFNYSLYENNEFLLSNNIESIHINRDYEEFIKKLPNHIKKLTCSKFQKHTIIGDLLDSFGMYPLVFILDQSNQTTFNFEKNEFDQYINYPIKRIKLTDKDFITIKSGIIKSNDKNGLYSIEFGLNFKQKLKDILIPHGVKKIKISSTNKNKCILEKDCLPNSITNLTIKNLNQKLINDGDNVSGDNGSGNGIGIIPNSIKTLKIKNCSCTAQLNLINNTSINTLKIDFDWFILNYKNENNFSFLNNLPKSLTKLKFIYNNTYNCTLSQLFYPNFKSIPNIPILNELSIHNLNRDYSKPLEFNDNITTLFISYSIRKYNSNENINLTTTTNNNNNNTTYNEFYFSKLPLTLSNLNFIGKHEDFKLSSIYNINSITSLSLPFNFNNNNIDVENDFLKLNSIKYLTINGDKDCKINLSLLPPNLESLTFIGSSIFPIGLTENSIPSTLKEIICFNSNQTIINHLISLNLILLLKIKNK